MQTVVMQNQAATSMLSSPDLPYSGLLSHPSSDEAYLEGQKSIEKRAALVNSSTSVLSSITAFPTQLILRPKRPGHLVVSAMTARRRRTRNKAG